MLEKFLVQYIATALWSSTIALGVNNEILHRWPGWGEMCYCRKNVVSGLAGKGL